MTLIDHRWFTGNEALRPSIIHHDLVDLVIPGNFCCISHPILLPTGEREEGRVRG
ncbi:MAG: hypothetical protein ABSB22_18510 [Thermodesulfobacteriota bacterium]